MSSLRVATSLFAALCLSVLPMAHGQAYAKDQDGHTEKQVQADIERHKAMAAAHQAAAQCLASGKGSSTCQKELSQACKGLALGKHCGMRHVH